MVACECYKSMLFSGDVYPLDELLEGVKGEVERGEPTIVIHTRQIQPSQHFRLVLTNTKRFVPEYMHF